MSAFEKPYVVTRWKVAEKILAVCDPRYFMGYIHPSIDQHGWFVVAGGLCSTRLKGSFEDGCSGGEPGSVGAVTRRILWLCGCGSVGVNGCEQVSDPIGCLRASTVGSMWLLPS